MSTEPETLLPLVVQRHLLDIARAAQKVDLYVDFSHPVEPGQTEYAPEDPAEFNKACQDLHRALTDYNELRESLYSDSRQPTSSTNLTVDDIIRQVRLSMSGRTYYEGRPPYWDEVLVDEIEQLRSELSKKTQD